MHATLSAHRFDLMVALALAIVHEPEAIWEFTIGPAVDTPSPQFRGALRLFSGDQKRFDFQRALPTDDLRAMVTALFEGVRSEFEAVERVVYARKQALENVLAESLTQDPYTDVFEDLYRLVRRLGGDEAGVFTCSGAVHARMGDGSQDEDDARVHHLYTLRASLDVREKPHAVHIHKTLRVVSRSVSNPQPTPETVLRQLRSEAYDKLRAESDRITAHAEMLHAARARLNDVGLQYLDAVNL